MARNYIIKVRVTKSEQDRVKLLSIQKGYRSVSEMIRMLILEEANLLTNQTRIKEIHELLINNNRYNSQTIKKEYNTETEHGKRVVHVVIQESDKINT